jgi:hypothetical protein
MAQINLQGYRISLKKTYKRVTDTLEQVTVEQDGKELTFLNGVIQARAGGKFIAATSPIDKDILLIIEDYVFWHTNEKELDKYIADSNGAVVQKGMVLHFNTEEDRVMFLLRWM